MLRLNGVYISSYFIAETIFSKQSRVKCECPFCNFVHVQLWWVWNTLLYLWDLFHWHSVTVSPSSHVESFLMKDFLGSDIHIMNTTLHFPEWNFLLQHILLKKLYVCGKTSLALQKTEQYMVNGKLLWYSTKMIQNDMTMLKKQTFYTDVVAQSYRSRTATYIPSFRDSIYLTVASCKKCLLIDMCI